MAWFPWLVISLSMATAPPAHAEGQERCLERLSRASDPSEVGATTCLALESLEALGAPAAGSCPRDGLLGIRSEEYREHGWWMDGPPNFVDTPRHVAAAEAAAGSKGCALEVSERCLREGFETVHLYVALTRDHMHAYASQIEQADAWRRRPETRDRVRFISTENPSELGRLIRELLKDCKLVSFLNVAAHGTPGLVLFGKQKGVEKVLGVGLPNFLEAIVSPCSLAPRARLQFNGCQLACGPTAEQLRKELEGLFARPEWGDAKPFDGVSLLLPTATTWIQSGKKPMAFSKNGLGIVYRFVGGKMTTDVPTAKAPECE